MYADEAREAALSKNGTSEEVPFGPEVLVYKVAGKMFATLVSGPDHARMNLKCDPHEALMLRDIFESVRPGYHMNKRHWNTVVLDGSIPPGEIQRMIDNSYALVVKGLRRAVRQGLEVRHGRDRIYSTVQD